MLPSPALDRAVAAVTSLLHEQRETALHVLAEAPSPEVQMAVLASLTVEVNRRWAAAVGADERDGWRALVADLSNPVAVRPGGGPVY